MMKFGLRELVFTSLMLGAVAGAYAMIVQPHASIRRQQLAEMRSMDADLSAITNSTDGLENLTSRVDQQRNAIALFGSMLPQQSDVQKAVNELLQTAAANSLQAGDVQLPERKQSDGLGVQPVSLAFTGNFNAFYSFLLQLEGMHHVMRLSEMKFHYGGAADGQIQSRMMLSLFFDSSAGNLAQAN
jgi:Tfp pilus assembly protein PilO